MSIVLHGEIRSRYAPTPWLVWGLAASFVLLQVWLQASPSVMVPQLMQSFAINTAQVGFLTSAFYYTYVFLQMPAGILVDRFGARRLLLCAAILLTFSCLLFSNAQHFQQANFSRALMGIAASPGIVAALFLARHWFPARRFALLVGLTEMLGLFGAGIGEPILGFLIERGMTWRETMWLCACVSAVLSVLIFFIVKDKKQETNCSPEEASETLFDVASKMHKRSSVLHSVLRKPLSWSLGFYTGLMFTVLTTFGGLWCVPFLEHVYSVSLTQASLATAMIFFGAGMSAPLLGWWSDRIGKRRILMQTMALIAAVLMLMVLYLPSLKFFWMFPLLFLLGAASSVYALPFAVMSDVIPPHKHAAAMGFTNMMCLIVGTLILQPLIGVVLEWTKFVTGASGHPVPATAAHQFHVAFSILPVMLFIAFFISLKLPETHPQATGKYETV